VQDIPGKTTEVAIDAGTPKVNKKGEMKAAAEFVKVREGVFNVARSNSKQNAPKHLLI